MNKYDLKSIEEKLGTTIKVSINSRGQLQIPKPLRDILGYSKLTEVPMKLENDGSITLERIKPLEEQVTKLTQLVKTLSIGSRKLNGLTIKEVRELESREDIKREIGGLL